MKLPAIKRSIECSLGRIAKHPFISDAHKKRLSKTQVYTWIMCAGRESQSFPNILEHVTDCCTNSTIRQILTKNLEDENGNGNPSEAHYTHYLNLLDEIGIPHSEFASYKEGAGLTYALRVANHVMIGENESRALGYLLVNEAMTPRIYKAIKTTVLYHHPDLQTHFFDLHVESDRKHVRALYAGIQASSTIQTRDLLFGIEIGERSMASLLDEAYGVFS